ncbi:MAG: TldD/PmbA family protein [Eubacteriales bacterium]|nr:TldD/PmbA family protein [Eubacteriales bacterium]
MEQAFIEKLLAEAEKAGIEAAEAYVVEKESFSAITNAGQIIDYKSNVTGGLGFRGLKNGRMGYAATEAYDDDAIRQLIKGVIESAELSEDTDEELLYHGGDEAPELNLYDSSIDQAKPEEKMALLERMEAAAKAYDSRVDNGYSIVETGKHTIRIMNSVGLNRSFTENLCVLAAEPTAKENGFVATGSYQQFAHCFDALNPERVAQEAAKRAVDGLHAAPVPSGNYRVVLFNEVMCSLLGVFSTIFSAETAQKGLSLLTGKLGTTVAAPCVTLVDDPLRTDALGSRPFDAEGVPSKAHTLIDKGQFRTFLHNLKTARKDGVETTANADKAGYAATVHVAPSNLFFDQGDKSFDQLLAAVNDGLVITEVSGLHAGANQVSGDFSLLASGYTISGGKRAKPVEQITVAGNYYELLKSIRAFGNDLCFPDGSIGSPSADVGELSVSGK